MTTSVTVLELTDQELELMKHSLRSYLSDFGHDEADVIEAIRGVLGKLESATADRR